jgi:hypothetical protein
MKNKGVLSDDELIKLTEYFEIQVMPRNRDIQSQIFSDYQSSVIDWILKNKK